MATTDKRSRPSPNTPAGERILAAAVDLFYARGIRAVGVDTLAEAAGTTKKTIYDRFGSKDQLVVAYLRRRHERWQAFLAARLARSRRTGADRVLAVLDAAEAWTRDHPRGCAFVNAHAEIGAQADHPGLAVITEEKAATREVYAALLREAGRADAEELASRLHLLHEGALVARTVAGRAEAFDTARAAASTLVAAPLRGR